MGPHEVSQGDVERAYLLVDQMLSRACSPVQVRRRVERILLKCDPDSHRHAFWRLILALIVAEGGRPRTRRVPLALAS